MSTSTTGATTVPGLVGGAAKEPDEATGTLATVDQLLRDRPALLERLESGTDLLGIARTMILTIVLCAGVFGAALGFHRGGVQILYAGVKLPLVILLTAAICTPALSALRKAVAGSTVIRRDLAHVLVSLALGSLILAALAPVVALASSWGASYHQMVLVAVGCCAIGGVAGLSLFFKGMGGLDLGGRAVVGVVLMLLVAVVGTQMTWTMRPYLLRPRTESVPFVRAVEGGFLDSVALSFDSARGVYHRGEAPLPDAGWEEEAP